MYPILFEVGGFPVYTYGVMLAGAYLLGLQFALVRARSRGLKADRCALLRRQLTAPTLHPKLHRAKPDDDPMFARQLLAHHIRVAAMAEEALPQPIIQPVECSRRTG